MIAKTILLISVLGCVLGEKSVFKSKAKMAITWSSVDSATPSSSDLYAFETAATNFLSHLLVREESKGGLLYGNHVLEASVEVMKHEIERFDEKSNYLMESVINVIYIGSSTIEDLDHILEHATEEHNGDGIFGLLNDLKLIDQGGTSFILIFTEADEVPRRIYELPEQIRRSRADQSLIIACIVLAMCLFAVSALSLWTSGGFAILKSMLPWFQQEGRRRPYNQRQKKDDLTQEETGSGILGAASSEDSENMPPGFTPTRGVVRSESEILSPLSQITNLTDTSSRIVPLGITSMRKLNRFLTPERTRKDASAFQMTRLSYT